MGPGQSFAEAGCTVDLDAMAGDGHLSAGSYALVARAVDGAGQMELELPGAMWNSADFSQPRGIASQTAA